MQQIWEKSFGFFYDGLKVPKSPFYLSPIWTVAVNYLISVVSHKRRFSVPRVIITGLSSIYQLSVVFFHRKKHLCIKLLLSATWEICHILLLFNCHEMSKWADEGRQWNIEDYTLWLFHAIFYTFSLKKNHEQSVSLILIFQCLSIEAEESCPFFSVALVSAGGFMRSNFMLQE